MVFNPMAGMNPWVLGQNAQAPQIPTNPVVPTIGGGTFPTHPVVTTPTPEAPKAPAAAAPQCPPGYMLGCSEPTPVFLCRHSSQVVMMTVV